MVNIKKWDDFEHWVEVDLDLCIGAADCVDICPAEVYILVDGKVDASNIGECTDCMACLDICPTDAIIKHSAW